MVSEDKADDLTPVMKVPPWEEGLREAPLLTKPYLQDLLERRSLTFSVRSVARLLLVTLPVTLLKSFSVDSDFIEKQRKEEKESSNKRLIKASELPDPFHKLAFLTIIKSSNEHYKPQSTKLNLFHISGVQFIITRFSEEGMQKVFGSQLIPYISSHHKSLPVNR